MRGPALEPAHLLDSAPLFRPDSGSLEGGYVEINGSWIDQDTGVALEP